MNLYHGEDKTFRSDESLKQLNYERRKVLSVVFDPAFHILDMT